MVDKTHLILGISKINEFKLWMSNEFSTNIHHFQHYQVILKVSYVCLHLLRFLQSNLKALELYEPVTQKWPLTL